MNVIERTPALPFALISIAPVLGHVFTPFLKFKGGKGIDTTVGIWSALTLWEVPVFLGGFFTIFLILKKIVKEKITDTLIVIVSMILLIVFVAFRYRSLHYILTAFLNASLLLLGQYREKLFK